MDFVKREDQNLLDEENYKEYMDNLQKSHQIDPAEYQHTQISMEQLHQAMQSSLNGSLVHNFQLPLSPRQMSTLMLKTNLHSFNEIPAHFRNLELNFAQNLSDQVLRHEEMTQNLNRNIDISLVRMGNDIDFQNNLNHSITQNLSEDLRLSDIQLSQLRSDLPHDLSHEMDLSHLNRQTLEQEMIQDEARRMVIQCAPENVMEQNLGQIGHRIDQVRGMEHRLVNIALERAAPAPPPAAPAAPTMFHIKAEQEEEPYYYDNMGQLNVNGINGQVEHPHTTHADTQMYSIYPPQTIPALNPIDLYSRQNYQLFSRDNPQNLVMHRQYDTSPYTEKIREESKEKVEEPKENLKPNDNKIFYNEFTEKEESTKLTEELSLGIKGEYICYKCNEVCPSKRVLKQHAKACQGKEETVDKYSKFGCSQCPYKCQSPAILKIHERTHSGEKPFSCNFCDYKSGQKNNVAKHILVHMKEKPFRCQYCEYRCAQKNNLVVHERTHTGYKPFACPYCEYRTVQKPNLVKHMYLHTDQKPYSCDVCSYKCVQKTNLTKHKQRHLNETATGNVTVTDKVKPYRPRQKSLKCPHCPYRCVQKSSMEKHLQFKHNIEFVSIDSHEDESVQNLSVKKDFVEDKVCEKSEEIMSCQVEHPHTTHADTQMYSIYPPQTIPALNPIDLYSRQNYQLFSRDNPQNLVMHRQYDTSPYTEKIREESKEKVEEPKENLKPNDNKIFYNEFTEKEESTKLTEELSLGIKGEYICYKCNEVCPSKRVLKQHAKACQGKEETVDKYSKFGCSQCPYKCQSPAILKIHERTHSGEKPFSCNFCDYKSGQKNNVAKHILVHMKEKPFRCQYCEYRCAQKNNLVVHERTHTGYKPFACPYCEYRTVQKPNLVKHMYLHTDQKPYSCDVCSYKCVQKTNLTKHKQRHLNETATGNVTVTDKVKPYRPRQKSLKCPHCPYRCVQKSSMEKHLQFKHNIEFVSIDSHEDESVQNLSVKKDFVEDKVCEKSEEIMS